MLHDPARWKRATAQRTRFHSRREPAAFEVGAAPAVCLGFGAEQPVASLLARVAPAQAQERKNSGLQEHSELHRFYSANPFITCMSVPLFRARRRSAPAWGRLWHARPNVRLTDFFLSNHDAAGWLLHELRLWGWPDERFSRKPGEPHATGAPQCGCAAAAAFDSRRR